MQVIDKQKQAKKAVDVIGVQIDKGAGLSGANMGPQAIRCAGLFDTIAKLGFAANDCGDIVSGATFNVQNPSTLISSRLKNTAIINEVNSALYDKVKHTLENENFPLVLGGDHSIAAASVLAVATHFGKIGLIWVDAHGDFNDSSSTPSGNIHGTPLSAITGNGPDEILPFKEKNSDFVNAKNTVIIGARDLDDQEKRRIKEAGVTVFSTEEIDKKGMYAIITEAAKIASEGTEGVYISFDLDALDPSVAPGVGTPVKGGLTYREAHLLCEYLAANCRLLGFEIVELNPLQDNKNQSGEAAVQLISSLLGKTIF